MVYFTSFSFTVSIKYWFKPIRNCTQLHIFRAVFQWTTSFVVTQRSFIPVRKDVSVCWLPLCNLFFHFLIRLPTQTSAVLLQKLNSPPCRKIKIGKNYAAVSREKLLRHSANTRHSEVRRTELGYCVHTGSKRSHIASSLVVGIQFVVSSNKYKKAFITSLVVLVSWTFIAHHA